MSKTQQSVTATPKKGSYQVRNNDVAIWLVRGLGRRAIEVSFNFVYLNATNHFKYAFGQMAIEAAKFAIKRGWKKIDVRREYSSFVMLYGQNISPGDNPHPRYYFAATFEEEEA